MDKPDFNFASYSNYSFSSEQEKKHNADIEMLLAKIRSQHAEIKCLQFETKMYKEHIQAMMIRDNKSVCPNVNVSCSGLCPPGDYRCGEDV